MKIAVAGTGYVGMSIAVFAFAHNCVTAVDIIAEKVEKSTAEFHRFRIKKLRNISKQRSLTSRRRSMRKAHIRTRIML